jgi:membrane fusion protein (multidrug efflux system)
MSTAFTAADGAIRARVGSRKTMLLAGAAILALIGAAWYGADWVAAGQYVESTDDAYVGGNVTDIAPKVSGIIAQIAVSDNQFVQAGDLLVKIDDRDFAAALAKAQAAVAGDQAAIANLDATQALQSSVIDEAKADVAAADAQLALARANQGRYARLAAANAGSEQAAQTAVSNFGQAVAAGEKARAALVAAQAQLGVIGTERQQAGAALAGARADLLAARLNLGYTEIRAPIDGVIGNRSAELGGYATAGAQLVSIVPARGLWVDANFKEDQLAQMRAGEPVTIIADEAPGQKIRGHVVSIAPATGAIFSVLPAENATGNFTKIVQRVPVRIALDGDAATLGLLRPGLSVTAYVNTR